MNIHRQVGVKVNALVDKGIVEVVSVLNDIEGISTFSSCEGRLGKDKAHVYFDMGLTSPSWYKLARFASKLAKLFSSDGTYDVDVLLEWTGDKESPFIALEFESQFILQVAKTLNDHKRELSDGI